MLKNLKWLFAFRPDSCAWLWRPLTNFVTVYLLNPGPLLLFLLLLTHVCLGTFDGKLFVFWENYLWDIFEVYDEGVLPWRGFVFATAQGDKVLWRHHSSGSLWLCASGLGIPGGLYLWWQLFRNGLFTLLCWVPSQLSGEEALGAYSLLTQSCPEELLFSCQVVSDSFAAPWTVGRQAPLSFGFSRQEYWSGLPFPPPRDIPDPGIEPSSHAWADRFFTTEPPGKLCTQK